MGQVLNRTFDLCASMIPEPNLWADLRDRDRGLDEVEYPPHHLEVAPSNTRWGISLNFVPPKEQIKHVFCPYFVWSLTLQCLFWVLRKVKGHLFSQCRIVD